MTEGAFASDKTRLFFPTHSFLKITLNILMMHQIKRQMAWKISILIFKSLLQLTRRELTGWQKKKKSIPILQFNNPNDFDAPSPISNSLQKTDYIFARAIGVYSSRNITDHFKLRKLHREWFLFNFGKHSTNPRRVTWYRWNRDEI